MKKKDLIYLLLAVGILLVAGYIGYTQLFPQKSTGAQQKEATAEVVGKIPAEFDQTALSQLTDPTKVRNFAVPIDLTTGLNNAAVFGP